MVNTNSGNRIKKLRKSRGLCQRELAKMIGVNTVTLSRYENGERNPKIDKLEAMSDIFKVSIDYITGAGGREMINLCEVTFHLESGKELRNFMVGQPQDVLAKLSEAIANNRAIQTETAVFPTTSISYVDVVYKNSLFGDSLKHMEE